LLIEALHTSWQNEEARETILPRLSTLLAQYREVINDARKAGEISPQFDPELVARMFLALPIGMSALDLAGLARPNDRHWMPVYEALRRILKSPQQP
jgi:hypothetical protein